MLITIGAKRVKAIVTFPCIQCHYQRHIALIFVFN